MLNGLFWCSRVNQRRQGHVVRKDNPFFKLPSMKHAFWQKQGIPTREHHSVAFAHPVLKLDLLRWNLSTKSYHGINVKLLGTAIDE